MSREMHLAYQMFPILNTVTEVYERRHLKRVNLRLPTK
jgi:hypothetical protein